MGATQSTSQDRGAVDDRQVDGGGILLVNPMPEKQATENALVLPKRVPPVLTVERHVIDPKQHTPRTQQLDEQIWVEFVTFLQHFGQSRNELACSRQAKLQEMIVKLDAHMQHFAESYVNGQHKSLSLMNEHCREVEEVEKVLHKCTIQSELCANMLNKLNFLLPSVERLEPLSGPRKDTKKFVTNEGNEH